MKVVNTLSQKNIMIYMSCGYSSSFVSRTQSIDHDVGLGLSNVLLEVRTLVDKSVDPFFGMM